LHNQASIIALYQNTKGRNPFVFLKPLQGLGFNSQKCGNTFVNWYYPLVSAQIVWGGASRRLTLFGLYVRTRI